MQAPPDAPSRPAAPSLSVADARDAILGAVGPVQGHETVGLTDALGRVLARDVVAPIDVPAHDNSAMDGYALRSIDVRAAGPARLAVIGTAFAGRAFAGSVGAGQAVRVMTGAVLPAGADTVVVQEIVRRENGEIEVPSGQQPGQNVRRAGEDLPRGRVALACGKRLGAAEVGLLASLGVAEAVVYRRPRVAFFSTGDELASIGRPLSPGEVYDSNRYTVACALRHLGVDALDLGVVRDQPDALEAALSGAAAEADAVITTGGVSVGEADHIKALMAKLGNVQFWRIRIRPGRPMAFGRIGQAWLFGLPGNPVAVMVAFYQFVADALRRVAGEEPLPVRPLMRVRSATALRKQVGRHEFQRGELFELDGTWQVRAAPNQGSGVLSSMTNSNCFIVLPEAAGDVAAGEFVEVQPFGGVVG